MSLFLALLNSRQEQDRMDCRRQKPLCMISSVSKFHHQASFEQIFLHLHFLSVGIIFNSTALGIHYCETSLIFNFITRLGGEFCLCDVNIA